MAAYGSLGGAYFYGDTPTSLDATVYGYLDCIQKVPNHVHNNWLAETLAEYPVLTRFTERYYTDYIQNDPTNHTLAATMDPVRHEKKKAEVGAEPKEAKPLSDEDQRQQWENRLWAGGLACVVSAYVAFMPHWYGGRD